MIRYSHVSLVIPCDCDDADAISATLGVRPTRVRKSKSQARRGDDIWEEKTNYTWMLDSPKSHTDGDPTFRLRALADLIQTFAFRLPDLEARFKPWIDIVYHASSQHPHGITGEFDWFKIPADLMRRYGEWDLSLSYETFWFDHPDWVRPASTTP